MYCEQKGIWNHNPGSNQVINVKSLFSLLDFHEDGFSVQM